MLVTAPFCVVSRTQGPCSPITPALLRSARMALWVLIAPTRKKWLLMQPLPYELVTGKGASCVPLHLLSLHCADGE